MAVTVAELQARLTADTRDFDSAMNRSEGRWKKFGGVLKRGALAAGAGIAALGAVSVRNASNLEEQINKTSVVFRGSERQILKWSETTATSFGISQRASLEAAGTFGNMLVPMGFAREEAGKMSTRMVELAADMASFNNASPEETLLALRSGLAGETEPLRKFGVFLNEARLKQEALNLGLKNAVGPNGALTANAKAQATYSLILKDSKDAQGDFARTSDSLANQQRILRAQFEDVTAQLGAKLIPVVVKVLELILRFVNWADGVNGLQRISKAWKRVVDAFEAGWQAVTDFVFDARTKMITSFLDFALQMVRAADKAFGWLPGLGGKIDAAIRKIEAMKKSAEDAANRRYNIRFVTNAGRVKSDIEDLRAGLFTGFGGGGDGVVGIPIGFQAANPGGLSRNVLDELGLAQQMGLTLTSGYRPGAITSTGNRSLHSIGKAIDVSGTAAEMARFFRAVVGRPGVRELLYSPLGGWYGGGGIVPLTGSVLRDHFDHVHVGVFDKGGWLQPGWNLAGNFTGKPERVGGGVVNNFNFPNFVGSKEELMSWLRNAVREFERRNGRAAFGG